LEPVKCQRKDCKKYAHHICCIKWTEQYISSFKWAEQYKEESHETLCLIHHPGYQKWKEFIESSSDSTSSSDESNENAQVSLSGNLSKLEKYPRFKLTY